MMSDKVQALLQRPVLQQRTEPWYSARRNCITASDIASALTMDETACGPYVKKFTIQDFKFSSTKSANPYSSTEEFIKKKVAPEVWEGNLATEFGTTYEPIAQLWYQKQTGSELLEFGLLLHPEYPWLGASPDGITPEGILVEIKCPLRRAVSKVPPIHYWMQMQLQMEVTNLDICHFLDMHMCEYISQETMQRDPSVPLEQKGVIFKSGGVWQYPPLEVFSQGMEAMLKWAHTNTMEDDEMAYFKIENWKMEPIERDRAWFEKNVKKLESVWNQVLTRRLQE